MIVTARPVRPIDIDTFEDITPLTVTSLEWHEGELWVDFDGDLTQTQVDAVVRRMQSHNANEEEIRRRAELALQANRDDIAANDQWLANNPGAPIVQRVAAEQSTRQARQLNGIMRVMLGDLDGVD